MREIANADICVTRYPDFSYESSAAEPIHERVTLMVLNRKRIPWKKWWSRVKDVKDFAEIIESARSIIP